MRTAFLSQQDTVIKWLIENDAKSIIDDEGQHPFHIYVLETQQKGNSEKKQEIIELLLKAATENTPKSPFFSDLKLT